MKERPILFSALMVRAILNGTKTQTRRVIADQPLANFWKPYRCPDWRWNWVVDTTGMGSGDPFNCPYGVPGDRLWVREAWRVSEIYDSMPPRDIPQPADVEYLADARQYPLKGRYRHARFMPRSKSRILLEITDVRVERLQEISEADATAEGIIRLPASGRFVYAEGAQHAGLATWTARESYSLLWESINGPGSWETNPWVWVVGFTQV